MHLSTADSKMGSGMMEKKICRKTAVVLIAVSFLFLLPACAKQKRAEEKGQQVSVQNRGEGYRFSAREIGIEASDVIQVCEKDGRIFILASAGNKTLLLDSEKDGTSTGQTKIALGRKETAAYLAVDGESRFRILTYENKRSGMKYYVKTIDEEGKILDAYELKQKKTGEGDFFPDKNKTVIADDGSVYVLVENQSVVMFGPDGEEAGRIDLQTFTSSLVQTADGSVYAFGRGNDGQELKKLDMETGTVSERVSLGEYQIYGEEIHGGAEGVVYIADQSSLYSLHLEDGKWEKLFAWADGGIDGTNVRRYLPVGEGDFLAVSVPYNRGNAEMEIVLVSRQGDSGRKEKDPEETEKKILTLACASMNSGRMRENILKFNQTNGECQIQVKDYSEYEDPWTQLNLDIMSGNVPDIFCLTGLPADLYVEKGLLADLYPFLEKDGEISAEDFVDSVRTAAERDGKLYYLGATFCLDECLTIGKKYIGDDKGWSIGDMEALYQKMPEDGVFINGMTRQLFIRDMILGQEEDYMDEKTGKADFHSEYFEEVLKFAGNFRDEKEVEGLTENAAQMAAAGQLMIYNSKIFSFVDISMCNTLFRKAEGYQVLGFPSKEESTCLAASFSDPAMAISEQCEDKEMAWEFLRGFFTYEYAMLASEPHHFPIRKDALEKRLAYAMAEEAYTDADGTVVKPLTGSTSFLDYSVELNPLGEEETAFVRSLIARVGKISNEADDMQLAVLDIVQEEAEAYFTGDKTAEETAEIIQNRVQLYLDENS